MVIINQSGREIINFDKIECIYLTTSCNKEMEYNVWADNNCIGKYKTAKMQERAFEEISLSLTHGNPIYRMPKE